MSVWWEGIRSALHDWQELAGAIIGGLFALAVAWYVARDARHRDIRIAAAVAMPFLAILRADYDGYLDAVNNKDWSTGDVPKEDAVLLMAITFSQYRHGIPAQFQTAVAQLSTIDKHLAGHLNLIATTLAQNERVLDRLERDSDNVRTPNDPLPRTRGAIEGDARAVESGMKLIANNASCAYRLIQCLVLSNFPTAHRLRMRLSPTALEKICGEALQSGDWDWK